MEWKPNHFHHFHGFALKIMQSCTEPITVMSCHGISNHSFTKSLKYSLQIAYCGNHTSCENFKLKLCTCAQSCALGTRMKFQLEILTINVISRIVYFRRIILQSPRNICETTVWTLYDQHVWNANVLSVTFNSYSAFERQFHPYHHTVWNHGIQQSQFNVIHKMSAKKAKIDHLESYWVSYGM